MGIFDFFRKIVREKIDTTGVPRKIFFKDFYKGQEIVIEKLTFSEIENWIERKIRENELKEKKILFRVEGKIKDFINELKEKIVILEDFDVEAKKEEDKIKNIVANSKKKYVESAEDLIEKLNNLEEHNLEKFIEKINKIFFDFNKSSFKNYERTTILIGKEMASIKESLKLFSKDLLKIFEEGKPLVDSFKNLLRVKEKLDKIIPLDKTLERISEKKSNLNKKISEKEEENKILKQNLEELKTGPAYLENLAKQEKIKSLREESKKYILELKQLLDFKSLAGFFRINPEQMKMVKNHREDFQINFEKDNGKSIISLLDEAKLNNDKIVDKIKQIYSKLEETKNHEQEIKEDKTQEVSFKIKEVVIEIDNLKIEKVKEEKRGGKLKTSREELISILKQELAKLNVEVV